MDDSAWRERLTASIEDALRERGISKRALSVEAGCAPNFVTQFLMDGKTPSTPNFLGLCRACRVSSTYVLRGLSMSEEAEDLLVAWSQLPAHSRKALIDFVDALLVGEARPIPIDGSLDPKDPVSL